MSIQSNKGPLLHFHDGIGDILQETRPTKLAIMKPVWISVLIAISSLFLFGLALNAVLNHYFRQQRLVIPRSALNETLIQQQNDDLIREMEILLSQSEPPLTLPPEPPLPNVPPAFSADSPPPIHPASPSASVAPKSSKSDVPHSKPPVPTPAPPSKPVTHQRPSSPVSNQKGLQTTPRVPVVVRSTPSPSAQINPRPRTVTIRYRVIIPQSSMADALKTRVRLNTLGIDSIVKSTDSATWLQLGAFVDKKTATDTLELVSKKGFSAQLVE